MNRNLGLPWWSSGSDSMLPTQGHRFNPWSGNWIPHVATLSLYATTKTHDSQINKYFRNEMEFKAQLLSHTNHIFNAWESCVAGGYLPERGASRTFSSFFVLRVSQYEAGRSTARGHRSGFLGSWSNPEALPLPASQVPLALPSCLPRLTLGVCLLPSRGILPGCFHTLRSPSQLHLLDSLFL